MSDQEFNVKLVGEVKKHEVLYNYTLPGYSRKDVTEKAWQLVAAKMNTSAADCKEKWRNLRTVFLRKLKPPKSGSGATRKAYYLENAMQFCLPFLKTSAPPSSGNWPPAPLSSTGDDVGVGDPENFDDALETQAYPSRPLDPSSASHFLSSNSPFRPNEDSIAQQSQLPIQPSRSIRSEKESALRTPAAQDASVAEHFPAKRARLEATEAEGGHSRRIDRQQSLKMYLLSLMPELLELSDSQIKLFKRRVFTLIDDISKD
ncbi:BESS motif [Nesidiocoris tenuis]|uniref:BESS motif n=1 Tax=Nesidiocoris tenuis TaxID=355587 RepID=A0ABN7B1H3_9HEMI|nr:BESS motif [Nesidiocoris tenuis]